MCLFCRVAAWFNKTMQRLIFLLDSTWGILMVGKEDVDLSVKFAGIAIARPEL